MKYTDGKNIMVCVQSADGAAIGAALETVSKAAELAKAAGVDVSTDAPLKDTIATIGGLIDEIVDITKQLNA